MPPAAATQRIRLAHRLAAAEAARRQHTVDDGAADPQQPTGGPAGKACRCLHQDTSSGDGHVRQSGPAGFTLIAASSDLPILLFDRRAWRLHRDRAARGDVVDFLHKEAADRLVERLDDVGGQFRVAFDLGAHHGAVSRALALRPGIERVIAADSSTLFLSGLDGERVAADPDLIPFRDGCFDLAVSALALHWAGDLPGALVQLRRVLRPGGILLAAMFGGNILVELRTALLEAELLEEGGASPRVSPAAELGDVAGLLLRTGFAMPVADAERITVTYPDALALMRDLRGMGESNALAARRRIPLRRGTLARAAAIYAERFGLPDGRIPATFEILFLTGWAP